MISEDKIRCEKMKLHTMYICSIAIACAVLVIILRFCADSIFKNCISVSSTITSIILSVIAIILSVTGERTTNEIRNKVGDSVEQLEKCTNKSSTLAEELTESMQQLNELYKNMNEKIVDQFPNFKDVIDSFSKQSEDNVVFEHEYIEEKSKSITDFLNTLPIQTRLYIKKALLFIKSEASDINKLFMPGDITSHLLNEGADLQLATMVTGITIGYLSSGVCNYGGLDKIIEKIMIERSN